MDISISTTYNYIYNTTVYRGQYFPSWTFWTTWKVVRLEIPWPLAGQCGGWAGLGPVLTPPTQSAALQLLQSSQHSTSGHHSVPSYRYTEFRSPLNSVKISIGYWRGLQVDWGWVAVKMQSTIWISWLDRSVISMLSSTWKSFENVLKKFINEVWMIQYKPYQEDSDSDSECYRRLQSWFVTWTAKWRRTRKLAPSSGEHNSGVCKY